MPIPVGSTAFPPPLPVSPNKVSTVLMSAPVNPGDVLVVQQATMQANTPVLALRIAKMDSTQFAVNMGVDPPTITSIAPGIVGGPWISYTPTVGNFVNGTFVPKNVTGAYTQNGKTVAFRIRITAQITVPSGPATAGVTDMNSNFNVTLPVAPLAGIAQVAFGWRSRVLQVTQPGQDNFPGLKAVYVLPSQVLVVYYYSTAEEVGLPDGDIYLQGTYEAA